MAIVQKRSPIFILMFLSIILLTTYQNCGDVGGVSPFSSQNTSADNALFSVSNLRVSTDGSAIVAIDPLIGFNQFQVMTACNFAKYKNVTASLIVDLVDATGVHTRSTPVAANVDVTKLCVNGQYAFNAIPVLSVYGTTTIDYSKSVSFTAIFNASNSGSDTKSASLTYQVDPNVTNFLTAASGAETNMGNYNTGYKQMGIRIQFTAPLLAASQIFDLGGVYQANTQTAFTNTGVCDPSGSTAACTRIYKGELLTGLSGTSSAYSGINMYAPTALRSSSGSGTQLATAGVTCTLSENYLNVGNANYAMYVSITCGAFSAMIGQDASTPYFLTTRPVSTGLKNLKMKLGTFFGAPGLIITKAKFKLCSHDNMSGDITECTPEM